MNLLAYNIRNLTDARYFAARGAVYLSFKAGDKDSDLSIPAMSAMAEWIEGPALILDAPDAETATSYLGQVPFTGVILPAEDFKVENPFLHLECLVKIECHNSNKLQTLLEQADNMDLSHLDAVLLHLSTNQEISDDIAILLNGLASKLNMFLDLGDDYSKMSTLLHKCPQIGVVLHGADEEKVGLKSFDEMDEFLENWMEKW